VIEKGKALASSPTVSAGHTVKLRSIKRHGAYSLAIAFFVAVCMFSMTVLTVQAHAAYKSSNPPANSVLKKAPTMVSITFVQRLSPEGLSIVVYGNRGEVVSTSRAQISFTDPYTASVSMKGDGSDIYRVDWNNVSAEDGDPTLGAFVFAVDPTGKSDKVTSSAPVIVQESPGVSPLVAVLIGLAGLVIGGVGGNYVANRLRGTVN
jgi:methionine-rich copper-binding protein CopC